VSGPAPRVRALLKFSVALTVIAILWLVLFDRLQWILEESERTMMAATVSNMASGLRLEVAARMIRGEEAALPALAGRNPIDFLATPPAGYRGDCPAGALEPGSWCFDAATHEIAYRPRRDRRLTYPAGRHELRWRIAAARPDGAGTPIGAIRLVSSASFTWRSHPDELVLPK